jgi:hypothetical protein
VQGLKPPLDFERFDLVRDFISPAGDQISTNDIGRYVGFCKEDGSALSWLQPVKNFMPNGLHAILLAKGPIVRLDMYRF